MSDRPEGNEVLAAIVTVICMLCMLAIVITAIVYTGRS